MDKESGFARFPLESLVYSSSDMLLCRVRGHLYDHHRFASVPWCLVFEFVAGIKKYAEDFRSPLQDTDEMIAGEYEGDELVLAANPDALWPTVPLSEATLVTNVAISGAQQHYLAWPNTEVSVLRYMYDRNKMVAFVFPQLAMLTNIEVLRSNYRQDDIVHEDDEPALLRMVNVMLDEFNSLPNLAVTV